jgi:hypothetical protein
MTVEQEVLIKALAYTRDLVSSYPDEAIHLTVYNSLIKQLRATFRVVPSQTEASYVLSPSRAVLKKVD